MTIPDSGDFDFGTDDFTIDFWMNPEVINGDDGVFQIGNISDDERLALVLLNNEFYLRDNVAGQNFGTPVMDWQHIAIIRDVNTLRIFQNGNQIWFKDVTGKSYGSGDGPITLGNYWDYPASAAYNGSIDEFRISKGIARWTENFTPPTEAYSVTSSQPVTPDYILPQSKIKYPSNHNHHLKSVSQIIGIASDDNSGVAKVKVSLRDNETGMYYDGSSFNQATETWLEATGTTSWTYPAPAWTDLHAYTIRSRATDNAGNQEHTDSATFTYDTVNGNAGSIYVSNNGYKTNANYEIYYTTGVSVPNNGQIKVDFPAEYRFNPWFTDSEVEITSNNAGEITSTTSTINWADKTVTSTITGAWVSSGALLTIKLNNQRVHNPSQIGDYDITTRLLGVGWSVQLEYGTGAVTIVKPYQQVSMLASVQQSLQLSTNSGSINIQVDPDVQQGQNWTGTGGTVSQYSDLEVKTNAANGYVIQVKLSGNTATGSAVLDGSGTSANQITSTSGARLTNENNFSFAVNNSGAITTELFSNISTTLTGVGYSTPTNSHTDTVSYYLNIDHTTPSDVYKGTVTYTAIGAF